MISHSFGPARVPSPEDCRDALTKGLGRARLWAGEKRLDLDETVQTCIQDLRYDRQFEDGRASWIWTLLETAGYVDECAESVWQAFQKPLGEFDASQQICELAMRFSLLGHERFTDRLFAAVRDNPIDGDLTLGEYQLLVCGGIEGFDTAARKRGKRLDESEWDWDDDRFIEDASEIFGRNTVVKRLAQSADTDIIRFNDQRELRASKVDDGGKRETHRERVRKIAVEDILRAAKSEERCYWFRSWGMHADQCDVDRVFEHTLQCGEENEISRLLRVFMRRELPRVDPILFQWCESIDEDLKCIAFRALEGNTHPDIRDFGLECLGSGDVCHALELLTQNYHAGDEHRIEASLVVPDDADECHTLLFSCSSFLKRNESADAERLALLIYQENPCSLCRTSAVKLLMRQGKVPSWMLDEIRFDCDSSTRELFYPQSNQNCPLIESRLIELRAMHS
ncbi:MAG: hypothetical protein AAF664_17730 [Planctomycetota bacterium]